MTRQQQSPARPEAAGAPPRREETGGAAAICGRLALKEGRAELTAYFDLDECAVLAPRHNIAPGSDVAVIRQSPQGTRGLDLLRWGLVPHWASEPGMAAQLATARVESIAEQPSFRHAYQRSRCLLPASGYVAWHQQDDVKQPYYVSLKSGAPMAIAGLWESWKAPDGSLLRSTCIVTTAANSLLASRHERMPVIVGAADWCAWLDGPTARLERLLAPYPAATLQVWPVRRRIGWARGQEAELIAPWPIAGG
jgi:putative SOS response-associated peptidase YedK